MIRKEPATPVQRNALDFMRAYQGRHAVYLSASGVYRLAALPAYWRWRSAWIMECLKYAPDWAKTIDASMQVSDIGFVAVGKEHVQTARPFF